ncbi:MAG: excinuclease ABC subunit UvrC [candidate division Zixibacteria bacterium]|nr:excinuclease ABC subunit UvrC [candidate division Zixibacteria bacterium]
MELKLSNLPESPGVYLFKNAQGKIIYIGKAKNLRNRVRSYFQDSHRDTKTAALVAQVADFELMVTHNEIESLILEANLVHEYKPRYNIHLKDDKHFPYIKVTTHELFPRVMVVRRLQKDGARYFGPYTNIKSIYKTLRFLARLFKIRSCHLVIPNPTNKKYKVCLDYHIKRCEGPCEGLVSPEVYRRGVDGLLLMLAGKSKELLKQLHERMAAASEQTRFEEAMTLRDQIEQIKTMMTRQSVDVGEVVDRDVVNIARESDATMAVVMQIREGVLIGRQDFYVESETGDSNELVLETFLTQYYNHQPNLPEEIVIPFEVPDMKLLRSWLRQIREAKLKLIAPKIGDKMPMLDLAAKNARLLLDEKLIQKRMYSERVSKMVVSLKDELRLTRSPRTMVCFDISNTGESDAVGSAVYFDNGKPIKNEYRHFRIKGVKGQDDFKMMREIVGRYFYHIKENRLTAPDLVVVDGGKGQLSNAREEMESLGFADQPIISLAKRLEEVFVPHSSDPITLPKAAPGLILLKRIRDEAHRFAVTYNRKVRTKRTIQSALDDIPGVGPAKRQILLSQFGSVERIRKLSAEDLSGVKGITPRLAELILNKLNSPSA